MFEQSGLSFEDDIRAAFIAVKGVHIPDMPQEILELDKEINGRYPNSKRMAEIISGNTKLSALLLQIANSPVMRPKGPITNIQAAVDSLGTQNLRNQLIAAAIMGMFDNNEFVREIMENSRDIAFTAAELSHHIHGVSADEAFLAGMFHHVGALLLACKDPEVYQKIFQYSQSFPYKSIDQEREKMGGTHNAAGVLMAKKWQLPVFLIQVIYEHHKMGFVGIKDEKTKLLVAMIALSTYIVSETSLGAYIGEEMLVYAEDAKETLMLDEEVIKEARMVLQSYSLTS